MADPDSIAGVHHSEGAVGRWWRAEVLGSSVTPGVGGRRKRRGKGVGDDGSGKKKGGLSKSDLGKMLSKALKLSFTREVEIIASTLQPASSVHTFTFQLANSGNDSISGGNGGNGMMMRTSMISTTTGFSAGDRSSGATFPYLDPNFPRPSSTYLGPTSNSLSPAAENTSPGTTYHGVCLTVWSHADEERSMAIRRTLETAARNEPGGRAGPRSHKISVGSLATETDAGGPGPGARRRRKPKSSGAWSGTEQEDSGTELGDSDTDMGAAGGPGLGASTLFLPPNTVFWLPYALSQWSSMPCNYVFSILTVLLLP